VCGRFTASAAIHMLTEPLNNLTKLVSAKERSDEKQHYYPVKNAMVHHGFSRPPFVGIVVQTTVKKKLSRHLGNVTPAFLPALRLRVGFKNAGKDAGATKVLALGDSLQVFVEFWVGDSGAVGVADGGCAFGGEARNREGHGDAVIAVRVDFRATQFSGFVTFDAKAIGALVNGGAHAS